MPAVIATRCWSCGGTHTVCLHSDEIFFVGHPYDYVCPKTKDLVEFLPANEGWREGECDNYVSAHPVEQEK